MTADQVPPGHAFIKRPSLPEPLAGRRNGPQHTRQQEMKS